APQALGLHEAVGKIGAAMGAAAVDETENTAQIAVEGEIFAQQTHWFDGAFLEFAHGGNGQPVAAQEAAPGRAPADFPKPPILRFVEHSSLDKFPIDSEYTRY